MTNGAWNLSVERIYLNSLTIDASQRLGIVIAQPYYELILDDIIPLKIVDDYRTSQVVSIERAFTIRRFEEIERQEPVPFIIFPEFSIPVGAQDGLGAIRNQMMNIEKDVIFIGGLEGLSREQAEDLTNQFAPSQETARPLFGAGSYVNMCVIAIKYENGPLEWHFQAKISPSQWEQTKNMAEGQRLLFFVGDRASFLCQICFDLIATHGEYPLNTEIVRQLIGVATPNAIPLDFVFVSQYNPMPNHETVHNNASNLLNYNDIRFQNNSTTVVFANRAASNQGSSEFGRSGCYYRSGRWQIPTSIGPTGYQLYDSDQMTLAIFRKRTAAIHTSLLVPPSENAGNPGNSRAPFVSPRSYLIDASCESPVCSCLPGTECDGGQYVECNCLPCRLRDVTRDDLATTDIRNRWQGADVEASQRLAEHYSLIRQLLLSLNLKRSKEIMDLLLNKHNGDLNPDKWEIGQTQFEAVIEMLSILSTIEEWKNVSLLANSFWTATLGEEIQIVLLDGDNSRYHWSELVEGYLSASSGFYYSTSSRTKPILLMTTRSSGQVIPAVIEYSPDITKPSRTTALKLGDDESWAKASSPRFFVCQASLIQEARLNASTTNYINDYLGGILG